MSARHNAIDKVIGGSCWPEPFPSPSASCRCRGGSRSRSAEGCGGGDPVVSAVGAPSSLAGRRRRPARRHGDQVRPRRSVQRLHARRARDLNRRARPLPAGVDERSRVPRLPRRGVGRACPRRGRLLRDAQTSKVPQGTVFPGRRSPHKRDGYRRAFASFDPAKVARFTPARVERLLRDPSIVRNRLKVESVVRNAAIERWATTVRSTRSVVVRRQRPTVSRWKGMGDIRPRRAGISSRYQKELKRRGFAFVGPTSITTPSCRRAAWSGSRHILFPLGGRGGSLEPREGLQPLGAGPQTDPSTLPTGRRADRSHPLRVTQGVRERDSFKQTGCTDLHSARESASATPTTPAIVHAGFLSIRGERTARCVRPPRAAS